MEEKCFVVEEKKSSFSSLMKGLLLGGLVGAGIALLSTPQTGMETRQMLRDKSSELKDQATNALEETRSQAQQMINQGMDRANQMRDRGQSVLNDQMNRVQNVVTGIREGVKNYQEQGSGGKQDSTMATASNNMTETVYPKSEKDTALVPEEYSPDETLDM